MDSLEVVQFEGKMLCMIMREAHTAERTTFLTPPDAIQQLGLIVYEKGGVVRRHEHKKLERTIFGTPEILVVRSGLCRLGIFNDARAKVAERTLERGDVVLLVDCGHEIEMLEPTVLLEVKQGPYGGTDDKEFF